MENIGRLECGTRHAEVEHQFDAVWNAIERSREEAKEIAIAHAALAVKTSLIVGVIVGVISALPALVLIVMQIYRSTGGG